MLIEVIKFITGLFFSIINPQTLDLLFRFKFYPRFEGFEDCEHICLPSNWIHPTSPEEVIYK
jgi:hypothetical protein